MANAVVVKPRAEFTRRKSSRSSIISDVMTPEEVKSLTKQHYDSPFDASLAVARKRSQQERLWEIFATYALQLSCEDPTRMRVANVIKILQDCGIIDGNNTEEAKMIEKEVSIVCESFLKTLPSDRESSKKLNFTAFLALLQHFAKMSGDQDPNRAYDSLVRTCLEKQQKPRARIAITKELQECRKVLTAFEDPLTKMFAFYATQSHTKLEKLDPKMALQSPPHMGYAECVAFGRKYGIITHGVLTTTEFATLYIDSLTKSPSTEYDRVLTYECFCELLVRLARKACTDENIPGHKKLKGLFQLMWLSLASNSPRALKITDVLKTDRVDVTKLFLLHFEKYWKKDHYEDYIGNRTINSAELDSHINKIPASAGLLSASPTASTTRPPMTRHLSLCMPTITTDKDQPKTLQRRFSMHVPSPMKDNTSPTNAANIASPSKPQPK